MACCCPTPEITLKFGMEVNFRKIDIDQFDEDAIKDSEVYEVDPRNPADVLDDAKQRQIAVRGLLARLRSSFFLLPHLSSKIYPSKIIQKK